ncbi:MULTISPECIES: DNA polymerase III subunit beta [unclassified Crossiella]|uniref:DNA polymerase III subunit beta n=1 Tax=unclassified Crossiella TaxID=2620835 RepID=UPI001FFEA235|nr:MULTISPECIES: DNA polymerase III subunit beta [unclassified Crossiella]MCK2239773.1 DNA polymerase III subunit beta [Crossiella sp. S99.2]MCK2252468.1 DNA polymerase III subunit beta [Crossiella sp. S99.1]
MTATAETPTAASLPRPALAARLSFTTDRATLADALTTVGLGVPTRPVLPTLGGARLEASEGHLTISATDYETTVTVRIPGTVQVAGILLVDHGEISKLLGALVKGTGKREADALPATVRTLDDGTPIVDLAGYTMPVTAYPLEDYPPIPEAVPTLAEVDRDAFARDMARVMVTAGKDDTLPVLTALGLEITPGAVTMAATDRYRLAVAPLPAVTAVRDAQNARALVLGHVVARVVKRFTGDRVRIGLDDVTAPSMVSLTCGPVTVSVHTVDAQAPPYKQLLPDGAAGIVRTGRDALLTATRRAAAVLDAKRHKNGQVDVIMSGASVSVTPVLAENTDAVTAPTQPATIEGISDGHRLRFNPAYLLDALNTFTGDTITVHTQSTASRPVVFTNAADGLTDPAAFLHLVMGVRIPQGENHIHTREAGNRVPVGA